MRVILWCIINSSFKLGKGILLVMSHWYFIACASWIDDLCHKKVVYWKTCWMHCVISGNILRNCMWVGFGKTLVLHSNIAKLGKGRLCGCVFVFREHLISQKGLRCWGWGWTHLSVRQRFSLVCDLKSSSFEERIFYWASSFKEWAIFRNKSVAINSL